jgi:methyl-accepting chemotaxis protein
MSVAPVVRIGNFTDIVPFMANVVAEDKAYDALSYALPSGDAYNSKGVMVNVADRDYFQRAMRGETVVSDPIVARTTGNTVTVIAVPVKGLLPLSW